MRWVFIIETWYKAYARTHSHLVFPLVDRLSRADGVLDAVEAVLGPDILLWGAGFFLKAPISESFISWHQDLTYWGLDGTDEVTAWLALSQAEEANGCMRFLPGSHRRGMVAHADTFADSNMLSRGQEIAVEVDEHDTVPVCLAPGELSLHHGRMFHASGANRTDAWRVGLAMQYITPSMRQVVASRDYAQLVRGEDRHGHFQPLPRPKINFDPEGLYQISLIKTHLMGRSWPPGRSGARRDADASGKHRDALRRPATPHRRPRP